METNLSLVVIGVVTHNQHAETALDLLLARRPVHAQHFVKVAMMRHGGRARRLTGRSLLLRVLLHLLRYELLVLVRVTVVINVEAFHDSDETLSPLFPTCLTSELLSVELLHQFCIVRHCHLVLNLNEALLLSGVMKLSMKEESRKQPESWHPSVSDNHTSRKE